MLLEEAHDGEYEAEDIIVRKWRVVHWLTLLNMLRVWRHMDSATVLDKFILGRIEHGDDLSSLDVHVELDGEGADFHGYTVVQIIRMKERYPKTWWVRILFGV